MFTSKRVPNAATQPNAFMIYNILKECKSKNENDLRDLWGDNLCSDIHGFAWSGHSVLVYSVGLNQFGKCCLVSLVKKNGLSIEWTEDPLGPSV